MGAHEVICTEKMESDAAATGVDSGLAQAKLRELPGFQYSMGVNSATRSRIPCRTAT